MILPLSALFGAAFLALADLVARTVLAPGEIPIGVVTAFFGAPFFVLVLRTSKRRADMTEAVAAIAVRGVGVRWTAPRSCTTSPGRGAGEWVTVIGPNGAGKSTLLRAVAGLLPFTGSHRAVRHAAVHAAPPGAGPARRDGAAVARSCRPAWR